MGLKAITFDLWETIIIDDSDEPKRAAQGLRPKPEERRHLFWEALNRDAPIDRQLTDMAFAMQEHTFRFMWYEESITWEASVRVDLMLKALQRSLPESERARLVTAFESMEMQAPPDVIDGAKEVIADLATRYKLCIISDTIYSSGRYLRDLLEHHGLKQHFSGFVFSDEAGHSKPHPDCFTKAALQLGIEFADMVHIGDRDPKDVDGAQAMGMKAILFTASRDEGAGATTDADGIANSYTELAAEIARLDAG